MIRRARAGRRPDGAVEGGDGDTSKTSSGNGVEAQPEETDSRYGALWQPQDLAAAMSSIFSDDAEYFEFSGRQAADLITTLIPSPDAVVVDLGCGIGRVAKHVAPKCGLLWAVDVSPKMLELAAAWLEGVPNVRLSLCRDDAVPDVADETADLVFALFVLQHVEREDAFLLMREVHRMLRPGGCAFLSFPNLQSDVYLHSFVAYAERGESVANPARARMYVRDEVTRLATAAGLVVVEVDESDEINVLAMRRYAVDEADSARGAREVPEEPGIGLPTAAATADGSTEEQDESPRENGPTGAGELDASTIDPPPTFGGLDPLPAGGRHRPGPVRLTGWVAIEGAPIDRVEIEVDGGRTVQARVGLVREDAWAATGLAHARLAGFESWIDVPDSPTGEVAIRAEAFPLGREPFLLGTATIQLASDTEPGKRRRRSTQGVLAPSAKGSGRDLNLAVFAHDLTGGGAQTWLWELLSRSGAGRSFPCTVIAPAVGPQAEAFESLGIAVHITRPCPVGDIDYYDGAVSELAALVASGGHTAVLVNTFVPFSGAEAAARLGLPCVWAIHESYTPSQILAVLYENQVIDPLVETAAIRALAGVSRSIFVSEATRALFLGVADPTRALVVHYGVDTAAIDARRAATSRQAARRELGLPPDATVILSVGVTGPRKAQTSTALAFASLAQEFPDAILTFLGAVPGIYAGGLQRYLEDAALSERTRVVPFVDDTALWYSAADLLVSASDVESLPRSVLEAMAFGVPVLATSVFGVPEVIEDGRNGWLFEPRSVGAAIASLRRVLSCDGPTRDAVAAAGRDTVRERFDVGGYVTAIPDLLRHLVSEQDA